MTKKLEIHKCSTCGNITLVVHASGGTLVCCGKPMELQKEKTGDTGKEKHVPVIEKSSKGVLVKVGSVSHPMEENHYIEWIEVTAGQNLSVVGLKPGEKPEAEFPAAGTDARVRAYCNVHGLWTNKL